jgi:non-ribosomal peptide synthase protein (TIGR01720 family)
VQALLSVKEQLRAVPRQGVGYGALRHLSADDPIGRRLAALPRPAVSFLYAGRVDAAVPEGAPFRPAPEPRGTLRHPADPRPHLLEVQAHVADGRLHVGFTYSEQVHDARTIEARLARCVEALRRIAGAARAPGAVLTPSDVPAARLGQRDLDRLVARLGRGREEHP